MAIATGVAPQDPWGDYDIFAQKRAQQNYATAQEYATAVRAYESRIKPLEAAYNEAWTEYNKKMNQAPTGLKGVLHQAAKAWNWLPDEITTPVESTLSGMYWTYSKFISQPLSFSILYSSNVDNWLYGDDNINWNAREVWNNARYTSPGQAIVLGMMSPEELEKEGINFYHLAEDRKAVDRYFSSGPQKYMSAAGDLAVAWWADPLVLAGKAGQIARQAHYVKPISTTMAKYATTTDGVQTFKVDELMRDRTVVRMMETVEKFKVKYGDDAALQLNKQMRTFRKSVNGAALASALTMAKSSDELATALRVSMGDRAQIAELFGKNDELANALSRISQAKSMIGTAMHQVDPASYNGIMLQGAMDAQNAMAKAIEAESGAVTRMLNAAGSMENMYFNKFTPAMSALKGGIVNAPREFALKGFRPSSRQAFNQANATNGMLRNPLGRTVYNGFYVLPMRILRYPMDVRPPTMLAVHEAESWRGLDANLRDVPSLDPLDRAKIVQQYMAASPDMRATILRDAEKTVVGSIAARHGVDVNTARTIYEGYDARRAKAIGFVQQKLYSMGRVEDPNAPGQWINAAEFSPDGAAAIPHPILTTQLENSHAMMDFSLMDKVVRRNGTAVGRIANQVTKIPHAGMELADTLNRYWKFSQLLRFAYGIRTVTDDLLGQFARFGVLDMSARTAEGLARSGRNIRAGGARGFVAAFTRGHWQNDINTADRLKIYINEQEIPHVQREVARYEERLAQEMARPRPRQREIDRFQMALDDSKAYLDELKVENFDIERVAALRAADAPVMVNGEIFRPAIADPLFRERLSASSDFDRLAGRSASQEVIRGRSGDWRPISAATDEQKHMSAWLRVLRDQFGGDELAKIYLRTGSYDEMLKFLYTGAGQRHRKSLGIRNLSREDLAERVRATIDEALPPTLPGYSAYTNAILDGTIDGKLMKNVPIPNRPMIQEELIAYNMGKGDLLARFDQMIDGWYKFINMNPTNVLVRNPAFAALYRSHLQDQMDAMRAAGQTHFTEGNRAITEKIARERALKDVRDFSFSMDFESRMAYGMRFVAPFFGAKMEGWKRWGRIIEDRPATVGYAGLMFNSPVRAGWTTDREGNTINSDGTVTDPVTGERRRVNKNEIMINVQIPEFMQGQLESVLGTKLATVDISLDSMNLVLQDDPIYSPGFGPIVQIPLNAMAKESPQLADDLQTLGILPIGVQDSMTSFIGAGWMHEVSRLLQDDEEFNEDATAVLRRLQWEYENGQRKDPPTAKEALEKAKKMTGLRVLQKMFLPFSVSNKEGIKPEGAPDTLPVQFFLNEYRNLMEINPNTGKDAFLDKYGESYFAFTTALSRNNAGIPATNAAMAATEKYADLLSEISPDLSALVVGPEGLGPYSNSAMFYQLHHETEPGSGVSMREGMSPVEYQKEYMRQQGWRQYGKMMQSLQADMIEAGITSFDDKRAQSFRDQRAANVMALTEQYLPDGSENPHYNRAWEEDFNTQDRNFYERRIDDLRKIVARPEFDPRINPLRSDIGALAQYIRQRDVITEVLAKRDLRKDGSADINAKSNRDLKALFERQTFSLIESNVSFGELHSRFLTRDMGLDFAFERR